jgi:hypothetical protein
MNSVEEAEFWKIERAKSEVRRAQGLDYLSIDNVVADDDIDFSPEELASIYGGYGPEEDDVEVNLLDPVLAETRERDRYKVAPARRRITGDDLERMVNNG